MYLIALLENFALPGSDVDNYLHDVSLCYRDTGTVFSEKLNFTFIELNKFVKEEAALQTDLDKWLFILKHLSQMDKLPVYLRKPIFEKLFNLAEYSKLTKEEKMNYDTNLKYKWDNENVLEYEKEQAVNNKLLETARKLKELGVSLTNISIATGLSVEEIQKLS